MRSTNIKQVVDGFKPSINDTTTNMEHLIASVTQVFAFLFQNSAVSRISILGDFSNYIEGNNSDNTQKSFITILGNELSTDNNRLFAFALVSTMQAAFLSQSITKNFLGYDFTTTEDRERFITKLIMMLCDGIHNTERSKML